MKTYGFNGANQYGFNTTQGSGFTSSGSTILAQILYDMNITDVAGTDYLLNQGATGATNDAIVLNATQDGIGSILVDGTTDIDTGLKPNLDVYSIEETVTGNLEDLIDGVGQGTFTQRTEKRLLTHDSSVLGDEASPNVTFDSNITPYLGELGIATWDALGGGSMKIVCGSAGYLFFKTSDTRLYTGVTYRFSLDIYVTKDFGAIEFKLYDAGVPIVWSGTIPVNTWYTITFTHTFDNDRPIYMGLFKNGGILIDDIAYYDNVSIREIAEVNKYYIDGLEQSSVPTLPDSDTSINLGNTAIIGYPDTIDSREANFEVWDTVKEN